ncbi:MAG TPA: hypothetical protein VE983_09855, partial [Solirubrobacteraceae bacterium]|nr:hypothetical protein [Solirubrobacteraceae bacterium]
EVAARVPSFFTTRAVHQVPAGSVMLTYPYPYDPAAQGMLWAASAHLRFRIIGDYAAIPGPGGRSSFAPLQLFPPQTEQLFRAALLGPHQAGAPMPPFNAATFSALRQFVMLYGIQTIVVAPIGPHPGTVVSYLTAALHTPPHSEGGVEVWFDARALASGREPGIPGA